VTDVSAVIGNYQGERLLPTVLQSLAAQTRAPIEVFVVDGASTDESGAVAEHHGAHFITQPNHGLGFLYNRGAEAATAPFVLFLNNDVLLEPDCVDRLAAALEDDRSRFAADAQHVDWDGAVTIHAHTTLKRGRLLREFLPGLHLDSVALATDIVPTVCANGAAMLVRRREHLDLGGFDETFFMEWEDLDLCWRAWLRGWPSVYVPAARVRHRVGASTSAGVRLRRSASSHHNLVRFALKCLPPRAAARVVAGEFLRLPRHPRAIARGLTAVAWELPEIMRLRSRLSPHGEELDAVAQYLLNSRLG